jgi:hypothetical protein
LYGDVDSLGANPCACEYKRLGKAFPHVPSSLFSFLLS